MMSVESAVQGESLVWRSCKELVGGTGSEGEERKRKRESGLSAETKGAGRAAITLLRAVTLLWKVCSRQTWTWGGGSGGGGGEVEGLTWQTFAWSCLSSEFMKRESEGIKVRVRCMYACRMYGNERLSVSIGSTDCTGVGSTDCTGVAKLTGDGRKKTNIHPDDTPLIHKWPPCSCRFQAGAAAEAMLIYTPRPVCLLPCGVMQTGGKYEIPRRRDARGREARRRTMTAHNLHL